MDRLFLHFINRELHISLDVAPDVDAYLRVIRVCTVLFDVEMACNISQIYEMLHEHALHLKEVMLLNKALIVELDSSYPTFFDFYRSRQHYYAHDLPRYAMYSNSAASKIFADACISEIAQQRSTTVRIEQDMLSALQDGGSPRGVRDTEIQTLRRRPLEIRKALISRDGAALTFPLFPARGVSFSLETEIIALRRMLSASYVNHYVDEWRAGIITGIPGIAYYDRCTSSNSIACDFMFMFEMVNRCGLNGWLGGRSDWGLIDRVEAWKTPEHVLFAQRYRQLAAGIETAYTRSSKTTRMVNWAIELIKTMSFSVPAAGSGEKDSLRSLYVRAAEAISELAGVLRARCEGFSAGWNAMEKDRGIRVLIMTATDLEDRVFEATLRTRGLSVSGKDRGNVLSGDIETIVEVFGIPGIDLRKVRSSAGSVGSSASTLVSNEALARTGAKFVISCGICFGMDDAKSKIGDVLVSDHVTFYEPGRVDDKPNVPRFKPRGPRIPAGPVLLDRAREAKLHWNIAAVKVGLLLSGEKLVDSKSFKEFLATLVEPEALGGEMEAAGIVSTAHRHKTEWIVVKGICDWGVGKGDGDQELAAQHAFDFTFEILSRLA